MHDLPFVPVSEVMEGPHGLKICYRRCGPPGRPTLLLIPGGGQSLLCWRKQMEPLSQEFQVVTWDLPGQGATLPSSPRPEALCAETFADAMEAIVNGMHLRKTGYIPVAWSFGGWVLQQFLHRFGIAGMHGLILVGTTLDTRESTPYVRELIGRVFSPDPFVRNRALLDFVCSLTEQPRPIEDYYLDLGATAWSALTGYLHAELRLLANTIPAEETRVLLCTWGGPVLYLAGEQDPFVVHERMRAEADALGAEVNLFPGGHALFQEMPQVFNEQVYSFAHACVAHASTPQETRE